MISLKKLWKFLHECWALPDADPVDQSLLLNRQLVSAFRIVPLYAFANGLTVLGVLINLWSLLITRWAVLWIAAYVIAQMGWVIQAALSIRKSRLSGPRCLTPKDLYAAAMWSALVAVAFGVGLYFSPMEAADVKPLMAAYAAGVTACGVLVGVTIPLLSIFWATILTIASCICVLKLNYVFKGLFVELLLLYFVLLMFAALSVSRAFVVRMAAEISSARARHVVDLLLGDFEAGANDWLWETDARGIITRASPKLTDVLNVDKASIVGTEFASLFSEARLLHAPSDKNIGAETLRHSFAEGVAFRGIIVERPAANAAKSWKLNAKPLIAFNGSVTGWRGVGSDVSDARLREVEAGERERNLHYMATHDPLTGLPNRRAFLEHMAALKECSEDGDVGCKAVMLVDVDNFKAVNDALGHQVGDVVLQHVAKRLRCALAAEDFLARLGGDEFAIVVDGRAQGKLPQEIDVLAQRLLQKLRVTDTVEKFQIDARGSIGITWIRNKEWQASELLREADLALYAAKNAGRDTYEIYEPSMGEKVEQRLSILSDLASAIERNEFRLVYQCIVDLTTFRVIGFEALLRWQHPKHGLILPSEFIPVAEESGLITPIGLWVLHHACKAATQWPTNIFIAINVSARQLNNPLVVQDFVDCIVHAGLDLQRVELEVTESSIVRDNQIAHDILSRLRSLGIRISLDDFGTGYSSMVQLRELPIDKLKLDRSFVAGFRGERAEASRSIVSSLLHLCKLMNLSVTAEGVETSGELDVLRDLGCQSAQGYLFSKPLEEEKLKTIQVTSFQEM